jgi:phosphatidylserine decarboxylase
MTLSIKEWLETPEIKEIRDKHTPGRSYSVDFFRDPLRSIKYNPSVLYAPADGVVLYARSNVKPDDFLEIKGKNFSLKEMLFDDKYDQKSLVIGIFMTCYDVHVNRVPCSTFMTEVRSAPHLFTRNSSMLLIENDLIKKDDYDPDGLAYLFANERKVSVCYSARLQGKYYIVQVADKDIDVIVNWGQGKYFTQGERFGQIRFGSQCDLVIPMGEKIEYEILVKSLDHVEAGLDPVVGIIGR